MTIHEDDPRLTAYALGEIENENERAEIEAALHSEPNLARTVDAIRSTAATLSKTLSQESAPDLESAQREALLEEVGAESEKPLVPAPRHRLKLPTFRILDMAAVLVIIGLLAAMLIPAFDKVRMSSSVGLEFTALDETVAVRDSLVEPDPSAFERRYDSNETAEPEVADAIVVASDEATLDHSSPVVDSLLVADVGVDVEEDDEIQEAVAAGSAVPGETGKPLGIRSDDAQLETGLSPVAAAQPAAPEAPPHPMVAVREPDQVAPATAMVGATKAEPESPAERMVALQSPAPRADAFAPVAAPHGKIRAKPGPDGSALRSQQLSSPRVRSAPESGRMQFETAAPMPEPDAWNREGYDRIDERTFTVVADDPLSTFSIDVDTASYANVRRFIERGVLPPVDAIRLEEFVNYFGYEYPLPDWDPSGEAAEAGQHPFSVTTEVGRAPWAQEHLLVKIGLQGYEVPMEQRQPSNLVFLVDVSGSMNASDKLPLVNDSLMQLVGQLDRRDRVAIVVYAGASGLVLPSTTADNAETIRHALKQLQAGGSTNGGQGIQLAYKVAMDHFIAGGNNRVILCTDGDFNVGLSSRGELTRLIEEKAKSGVFLTICGFGTGNLRDGMMEDLTNRGNGNYAIIDSPREARKVFGTQLTGTLLTIAKDVKIQVEFNPRNVASYRLLGYENRALAHRDFNDDTKDAGEIGAGHTVTALYEIIPVGAESRPGSVDPLRYSSADSPESDTTAASADEFADELMTVKLRYKQPDEDVSTRIETTVAVPDWIANGTSPTVSTNFRWASAVAEFALLLRRSPFAPEASWDAVIERARSALGTDPHGYRAEFLSLCYRARDLHQQLYPDVH